VTRNPPQVEVFLDDQTDAPELLTLEIRKHVYKAMSLTPGQEDELESMIRQSPNRKVGEAALNNVRAALQSKKNGATRIVESHTCELAFAYELELDPTVLGYYTQVPCAGVKRVRNDRQYVHAANLDFLVFRADSIHLVECKYESWLEKTLLKDPESDFRKSSLGWTHAPFAERAQELGIQFHVWMQRTPMGLYVQNLEACAALVGELLTRHELAACKRAKRLLREYPYTVETLSAAFPHFTERTALWMIANGYAFGLMRSATPVEREGFVLFAHRAHAEAADAALYAQMKSDFDQPKIEDEILNARTTDLVHAERRLSRLEEIAKRPQLATERMTQLAKAVASKVADGMSAFAACLTNFGNCGKNTPSPLSEAQHKGIAEALVAWNKGKTNSVGELWLDLNKWCGKNGARTPCKSTLANYVAQQDPRVRALARGGFRNFHAVRPRTGGDKRALPPLAYGFLLIIDSSGFDARCAPNLLTLFPAEKPRFYLGLDGATGEGMAHAFMFGAARTDGMALLIREYVHRHGFLPRVIQVDRGTENTSNWLKEFCRAKGITLRHTPTGGSQYNGAAENAIKQVNTQIAHRVAGSSEPDMAGRKVDGRFKSRKTARHTFVELLKEFIAYVYCDIPKTPDSEGITPEEKREEILATMGCLGRPCTFDDALLIHTSIRIDHKANASEKSGVRTGIGYFTSEELQRVLRDERVDEVRTDCADPSVLWVKVGTGWWKAFHRTSQVMATLSAARRLFELLFKPYAQRQWRTGRTEVAVARHDRQSLAFEANEANSHLAPKQDAASPEPAPEAAKPRRQPIDWNSAPTY
jgi:putative transposase